MAAASCGVPTILPSVRRVLLPLLFALLALASCGDGGDTEDRQGLVDAAFSQEMRSADLKLDAELRLEGSPVFDRPLRIQAAGPFRTNRGKLPSVDLEVEIGTDGGGQTVTTGFLSTGDRAFVKFQDVYYEQPASEVRRASRAFARNQRRHSSVRALGLDPRSWLLLAEDKGEEDVAGGETSHLSGTPDVGPLLSDVNGDQEIEAPRKARPLAKLSRSLGGLDALIELAGGDDAPTDHGELGTGEPEVTPPGGDADGETAPDDSGTEPEEAFRDYAECLDDARSGDTEALQNCAELLQRP